MRPFLLLMLVALAVGCHLDKLLSGHSGGPRALSTAAPAGLAFTSQPRGTSAGQPLSPDVQVSVVDSAGHPVAGVDTTTMLLALAQNPGGATLHGTTTTHPQQGVATFRNVSLDNAGNGYTLKASAAGLSTVSTPFDIAPPPASTGTLTVTTNTAANPPAAGYTVALDGGTGQPIGASQTINFPGLSPGNHSVALGSVPSNCTVSGPNPQTVTITASNTSSVTFTITCSAPPTGSIAVTTSTSGSNLPTSGYTVALDGGAGQAIGINGSYTFSSVAAGSHSVVLAGVPGNCTVSGGATQTVTVSTSSTASAAFTITCTAPPSTGSIAVATSTSGSNLPTRGYTVALDGGAGQAIGINGSVTFNNVAAGSHSVALSGVPGNCTVSGGATQTVTVSAGATASAPYTITCTAPDVPPSVNAGGNQTVLVASLPFTLQASFSDPDLDGPWTYKIDWGDGSSTTGSATSPGAISQTHSYPLTPATYTITVTVTDGQGISGSDSLVLTVVL